MSSKVNGVRTKSLKKGKNQIITSFKPELVVVWIGAGCSLDRVWIGLDPGLDRPRSEPTYLYMLQLGCSIKKRTTSCYNLAAWQTGYTTCNVTMLVLQFDSVDA